MVSRLSRLMYIKRFTALPLATILHHSAMPCYSEGQDVSADTCYCVKPCWTLWLRLTLDYLQGDQSCMGAPTIHPSYSPAPQSLPPSISSQAFQASLATFSKLLLINGQPLYTVCSPCLLYHSVCPIWF